MKSSLRFIIAITFLLNLPAACFAGAAAFSEGNDFYKRGLYDEAIASYNAILKDGRESAAIHYNLGNSYFRKGEWGRSVLCYERALRLNPRDRETRFNERLAIMRSGAPAPPAEASVVRRLNMAIFRHLTLNEMTLVLTLVYLALLCLIGLAMARPPLRIAGRVGLAAGFLLFLLGNTFLYDRIKTLDREGIVLEGNVAAKFGPFESATTYFELSEGMKVTTLETEDGWTKIRRPDGKIGWIKRAALELISLP